MGWGWDAAAVRSPDGATSPCGWAQSSDSGASTRESRAPAAALGAQSTHQAPRTRAGGLPIPWHRQAALQHQGFVSLLPEEQTWGRRGGRAVPPAHRSLAGSSGGRTATPPHQGHLGPLLIKLKRPHAPIPQDLPIKVFWCGSKLNHSYLAGTVEALTSQQLKGFWLAPFPLKHACWL